MYVFTKQAQAKNILEALVSFIYPFTNLFRDYSRGTCLAHLIAHATRSWGHEFQPHVGCRDFFKKKGEKIFHLTP